MELSLIPGVINVTTSFPVNKEIRMNESFCQYFHKSDDIDKYSCISHCNSAHNWNIPVLAYFILPRTAQGTLAVGDGAVRG